MKEKKKLNLRANTYPFLKLSLFKLQKSPSAGCLFEQRCLCQAPPQIYTVAKKKKEQNATMVCQLRLEMQKPYADLCQKVL